MLAETEDLA